MTIPLLKTKLYVPPIRHGLVSRLRLIERINAGIHAGHKLTLISAPAGFGKTTLLSEWIAGCGRPVAWLSLDEQDDDLARFLAYLVGALRMLPGLAEAGVGESALGMLHASRPQPLPVEAILTTLINDIATIPTTFILVLDDYHLIQAQPIHDALTFLLDHLPPSMHLALATRANPPLPVARLRGRGQLSEIRQADLRFTVDEAAMFLNQVMGLGLSIDSVVALARRLEGWIAGLQMTAISMRGRGEITDFIEALAGATRHILDYLVEEVLQQQSTEVQSFLLRTAILDRLCGSLCDAVTGQEGGKVILRMLEHANLFVAPLDEEHHWYRYHRLFADMLVEQMTGQQPDQLPDLHRRAAQWYEQSGFADNGVKHALAAGDAGWAARMVEQAAEGVLLSGQRATLQRWLRSLPKDTLRDHPLLCAYRAFLMLAEGGQAEQIELWLSRADEADSAGVVTGEISLVRAYLRLDKGAGSTLDQHVLDRIPNERLYLRSFALSYQGVIHKFRGDLGRASQSFSEMARIGRLCESTPIIVDAFCQLAEIATVRGQLHQAEALYVQALELCTDRQGRRQMLAGEPLIGLGRLHYERNDPGKAKELIVTGIDLLSTIANAKTMPGYLVLAHIWLSKGDEDKAHQSMLKAQQIAESWALPEIVLPVFSSNKVEFELAQGDIEEALWTIRSRGLTEIIHGDGLREDLASCTFPLLRTFEYIGVAKIKLMQGHYCDTLSILDSLLELAVTSGWSREVINIQVLRALAMKGNGDLDRALDSLGRALSMAEPEGFARAFVGGGRAMFELLHQAAGRGIASVYTRKLLSEFRQSVRSNEVAIDPPPALPLIEPLTARETEVVRLLLRGWSDKAISQELVISIATVRKHLKNIYGKLGVHSRGEAVASVRELGWA
jgi:LuxR family maltose regulon positive regulatory protein